MYEIAGKRYLLFKVPVTEKNSNRVERLIKKFDCINQGIEEIDRGGFWGNMIVIFNILVPEENVIKFNKSNIW